MTNLAPQKIAIPTALMILLLSRAAFAGNLVCSEYGLQEFEIWVDQVTFFNPGIERTELLGAERERLLKAVGCEANAKICPPDRVFSFYCTGNSMVLIAYETGGCATFAGQIEQDRFRAITEMSVLCQSSQGLGPLIVPDG